MSNNDKMNPVALGFLTIVEHEQYGLCGGYLVLDQAGMPLEFHCTAPIKPNRAQEILYGPTLEAFLYGQQIGQTLIGKSKIEPLLVCTDRAAALQMRKHVALPVALVVGADAEGAADSEPRMLRVDGAHSGAGGLATFPMGRNRLAVSKQFEEDRRLIEDRIAEVSESFDFDEPFSRIREAIAEAQNAVRQ